MFERNDTLLAFRSMSQLPVESLPIEQAFGLLIDFHERDRAIGAVPLGEDGDMLLLQWGVSPWANATPFEVNLTRQIIFREGVDDEICQLLLTFSYASTPDLEALGKGSIWFGDPGETRHIRQEVLQSEVIARCSALAPNLVSVRWEQV